MISWLASLCFISRVGEMQMNFKVIYLLIPALSSMLISVSVCHSLLRAPVHNLPRFLTDSFGCSSHDHTVSGPVTQKAKVFYNTKGLGKEIIIEDPLRELEATSHSPSETTDELIEKIALWIPKMYRQNFLINPKCIIILETKINHENKAQVRFGVAMRCTPRHQSYQPECI